MPTLEFVRETRQLEQHEEVNYVPNPVGPSSQACCNVTVGNVCGTGSLVGKRNGNSLILTNAHVASTQLGREVNTKFPFLNNRTFNTRIVMAAYSKNSIGMDWAILEAQSLVPLPHVKLDNRMPSGRQYTAGYPKCQGPRFQEIVIKSFMNNGTIARWQPNSIGGQSGSAVHSKETDLQTMLLTWTMSGDGAGQTAYGIWLQYANRAAVGFQKPEGLVEVHEGEKHPDDEMLEGFHYQTDITTLDIWQHLESPGPGPDPEPGQGCEEFAKLVLTKAESLQKEAAALAELARKYGAKPGTNGSGGGGQTFGL